MLLILAGARAADIYTPFYPKAAALVAKMTVEQKIGQMIQADFDLVTEKGVTDTKVAEKYFLGSLLIGGDGVPNSDGNLINLDKLSYLAQVRAYLNATKDNWLALTSKFKGGLKLTLKDNSSATVGYLLGTDAVHGNQHTLGTVLFPHNLGLSNSHNESHF
jgi:beta-glucosidase